MPERIDEFTSIPCGPLGIIPIPGCEEMAKKLDDYIKDWRDARKSEHISSIAFSGYIRETYIINTEFIHFGTGEGKAVIHESVRGYDLYILCDMFNYGVTTERFGIDNIPMGPDDHYANLKRAIAACAGKAKRLTVIMPMLYEGRQHKRSSRESLDCAIVLQELCTYMGVDNILTFDAHDSRVQNAIPLNTFENLSTTYQMIKAFVNNIDGVEINREKLMVISPDEGGMSRCIYYSTVLGIDIGMFYKLRDYSRVEKGRNPIIAHQFLGDNVEGKDVIIVDDMISSGESMLEVAGKLKDLGAGRVFVFSAFGLFCNGLDDFDAAYESGLINGVFTTNLVYRSPSLLERKWYKEVDMSKFISLIIDTLNHDRSISEFLSPAKRINNFLKEKGLK